MKKYFLSCFFLSFLFWGCKKELTFEEKVDELTLKYVQEELYISEVDSIKVLKIDTVTRHGYVQLNIELLEQMEIGEYYEIQNAIQAGDMVAEKHHEVNMKLIGDALEQWRTVEKSMNQNDNAIYRYLVTANYYAPVGMDQFYYFLTSDLQLFVLDPYDDELMQ